MCVYVVCTVKLGMVGPPRREVGSIRASLVGSVPIAFLAVGARAVICVLKDGVSARGR